MGAAIHAASLSNETQDSYLLDVTPLDLRIGVAGGLAETVIERNTPVPIEQTRNFTTFQDFQESVRIGVYQGDDPHTDNNEMLGEFEFSGFEPERRGEVSIEVTFEIDADGVVNVSAKDLGTGKSQAIQVTASSGLDESEVDRLVKEAEEHGDEDRQRAEFIELRNKADGLIYSTERTLVEFADNVNEDERKALVAKLLTVRDTTAGEDIAALRSAVD